MSIAKFLTYYVDHSLNVCHTTFIPLILHKISKVSSCQSSVERKDEEKIGRSGTERKNILSASKGWKSNVRI